MKKLFCLLLALALCLPLYALAEGDAAFAVEGDWYAFRIYENRCVTLPGEPTSLSDLPEAMVSECGLENPTFLRLVSGMTLVYELRDGGMPAMLLAMSAGEGAWVCFSVTADETFIMRFADGLVSDQADGRTTVYTMDLENEEMVIHQQLAYGLVLYGDDAFRLIDRDQVPDERGLAVLMFVRVSALGAAAPAEQPVAAEPPIIDLEGEWYSNLIFENLWETLPYEPTCLADLPASLVSECQLSQPSFLKLNANATLVYEPKGDQLATMLVIRDGSGWVCRPTPVMTQYHAWLRFEDGQMYTLPDHGNTRDYTLAGNTLTFRFTDGEMVGEVYPYSEDVCVFSFGDLYDDYSDYGGAVWLLVRVSAIDDGADAAEPSSAWWMPAPADAAE